MNGRSDGAMPRWVKGLLVVAVLALIGLGVLLVAGGEEHGPGRHAGTERSTWS